MNIKILGILTLSIFAFSFNTLEAQESLNSTGGNTSGDGGSTSYSIGQITYQTHTGTSNTVTQGVQQPYEISIVTEIGNAKGINLSFSAYPNPTTDFLTLEVKDFELSNLHFQLFDMNGKLLQTKKMTDKETQIDMSSYANSSYFIRIIKNNQLIKTFKIIKR
jgi:hypothetical protein